MTEFTIRGIDPEGFPHGLHCTGENTELYIHGPNYTDVDHIFHRYDERDRRLGAFIWRKVLGDEEFGRVANMMRDCLEFQLHYRPEPTEADIQQFLAFEAADIDRLLTENE